MPFPLAHPAAILPLRRFSPRWLDPAALVVGSIVPDTSYFLARWHGDALAHSWPGTILYALPAGLLALLVLRLGTVFAVRRLGFHPGWVRLLGPAGPLGVTLLSLCLGAATHVAWDAATHKDGWLAQAWPFLMRPLFPLLGRSVRAQHLLWYLSSFGGLILSYWAFDRAARLALDRPAQSRGRLALEALLFAAAILPVAAIHHLLPVPWGNLLAAACTGGLLLYVVTRLQPGAVPARDAASRAALEEP